MNYHLRFMATFLLSTVIAGCGKARPDANPVPAAVSARQKGNASVNPEFSTNDQRIVAFVSWVKRKGVTLESIQNAEGDVAWRLAQPKTSDEYDVVFHFRSFPTSASEAQMREALDVNLAYQLNAPVHLAMSYAGFSGKHPNAKLPRSDDELPTVNGLPITTAVERWFIEYKGG